MLDDASCHNFINDNNDNNTNDNDNDNNNNIKDNSMIWASV